MTTNDDPIQVQTQAPIGPFAGAALSAMVALSRLLRLYPTADITSIRFTVEGSGNPYGDDGPYVHAKAQLVPGAHLVASEAFVVPDDELERVTAEQWRLWATGFREGWDTCEWDARRTGRAE